MKRPLSHNHPYHLFFALLISSIVYSSGSAFAQATHGVLKGQVLTSESKPADNVSVFLKNTQIGTSTNDKGAFELKAAAGSYNLIISQIGAKRQEISIEIRAGEVTIVPAFNLNITNNDLQQVTISSGRINKFTRKKSDYVAKMPLNNMENPQVYTVISKELLKDQQINNVDDALKNAPGVTKLFEATSRAGSGGTQFVMRGFATQAKLRNGLAGNITTVTDAVNVEAIEVIKGPSATLFGNSLTSYGGMINRVTKKPFKAQAGEVSYYGGSYGMNRISADYNTPLDSAGNVLFRVNTAYNYQNNFQDNGFRKSFLLAPTLFYKASDRLSFNLDAEFSTLQSGGSQYLYIYTSATSPVSALGVNRADQVPINYKSSFSGNDVQKTGQNVNVFGQMDYKISSAWKSQTNFSVTTSMSKGSAPYFYLIPGSTVRSLTGVNTYTDPLYLERMVWQPEGTDLNAELQQNFTGDFKIAGLRNRLSVGLDYFHSRTNIGFNRFSNVTAKGTKINDLFDFVSVTNPGNTYYNFNQNKVDSAYANRPAGTVLNTKADTYTYSAYAANVVNITDNFLAMLSLRIDRFENKGILNNSTNVTSAGYGQTALSPKFGLVYQILPEKVSLFCNYQTGFTNRTGTDFEGKTFKPEHANQAEGGVKYDLLDGKLSGSVSYYNIKVVDIVRAYDPNPTLSIQNGTQRSKGVEVEVISNPLPGLNVIAGYGYNDSKYINTSAALNGRRPTSSGPGRSANLWASYRISNGVVKGLGAGIGGNYGSDVYAVNSATAGVFLLPSYTVYNAAVFYDQARYRVGLKMNNIGNKHYWVGSGTMNPQMLRELVANVSFKF
ncbi:TonB-dependent receptor domain-containing protein [Mucilaginibacter phyllosphaerae]